METPINGHPDLATPKRRGLGGVLTDVFGGYKWGDHFESETTPWPNLFKNSL